MGIVGVRLAGRSGVSGRSRAAATIATFAAVLLVPSHAGAATTIGSDLAPDPVNAGACTLVTEPCTIAISGLPAGSGSVTSPISGVVVRYRVRVAGTDIGGNTVSLRVLRQTSAGQYTGINSSDPGPIPDTAAPTNYMFTTRQSIQAGDYIGLDVGANNANLKIFAFPVTGAAWLRWEPPLADGSTEPADFAFGSSEPTFNADVEADCDADGLGDETQDPDISSCSAPPPSEPPPSEPPGPQCAGKTATISARPGVPVAGSGGPDVVVGTNRDDKINVLGGNDLVCGLAGDEVVKGGSGKDTIEGGTGKDRLEGSSGNDLLVGDGGADTLVGGPGNDRCIGGSGKNRIVSC